MAKLALALFVTALCANLSLAGDMFNDLIYNDQHQSSFSTGYHAQSILPGGCTKPDIGQWGQWNDPWSQGQQNGRWTDYTRKYDRPGYWDDSRWPQKVPRYYRRQDKYSQYDYRYSDNNLYAPGNEWLWRQGDNYSGNNRRQQLFNTNSLYTRRRQNNVIYRQRYNNDWNYRQRQWDRNGNWWNTPNNYIAYNMSNYNSRSYGYWDGNRMVTGFDSPNTSFRIGMDNSTYYDPWTYRPYTNNSMSFGLNLRF